MSEPAARDEAEGAAPDRRARTPGRPSTAPAAPSGRPAPGSGLRPPPTPGWMTRCRDWRARRPAADRAGRGLHRHPPTPGRRPVPIPTARRSPGWPDGGSTPSWSAAAWRGPASTPSTSWPRVGSAWPAPRRPSPRPRSRRPLRSSSWRLRQVRTTSLVAPTSWSGRWTAFDPAGRMVAGRWALDAGASTGGFTDVLLRRGAAHVIAVDVGYGQLAWSLRSDERVTVMDRTNIRGLTLAGPAPPPGPRRRRPVVHLAAAGPRRARRHRGRGRRPAADGQAAVRGGA